MRVYVPHPHVTSIIDPASGIVGTPTDTGRIHIYYEGDRYATYHTHTWADRLHTAGGRAETSYPTTATAWLKPERLIEVGTYDSVTGVVTLHPDQVETAAAWLGLDVTAVTAQLQTTNVARHQLLRDIAAADESSDPAVRARADWARHYYRLNG